MTADDLRNHINSNPDTNKKIITDTDSILVRYLPKSYCEAVGLKNGGHYFELRSSEFGSISKLSEPDLEIKYANKSIHPSMIMFENYGGGYSNRALVWFSQDIEFKDDLVFALSDRAKVGGYNVVFSGDKIDDINNISIQR